MDIETSEVSTEESVSTQLLEMNDQIEPNALLLMRGLNAQIGGLQMQLQAEITSYALRNGWNLDAYNAQFNIETGMVHVIQKPVVEE